MKFYWKILNSCPRNLSQIQRVGGLNLTTTVNGSDVHPKIWVAFDGHGTSTYIIFWADPKYREPTEEVTPKNVSSNSLNPWTLTLPFHLDQPRTPRGVILESLFARKTVSSENFFWTLWINVLHDQFKILMVITDGLLWFSNLLLPQRNFTEVFLWQVPMGRSFTIVTTFLTVQNLGFPTPQNQRTSRAESILKENPTQKQKWLGTQPEVDPKSPPRLH